MQDYKSKSAFGTDVMPHNKEANFINVSNRPVTGKAQGNNGNTNTARVQKATKSDATPAKSGGAFKRFIKQ